MTYPRNADLETPDEDAAEQRADAYPDLSPEDATDPSPGDIETPEAAARAQREIVQDDDEYR